MSSSSAAQREYDVDVYGKGEPFDRLQFGYSPAIAEEAVAYHSLVTPKRWIKQRRENYRSAILRRRKLPVRHFEGLSAMFKLKQHWKETAEFQQKFSSSLVDTQCVDGAEKFLEDLWVSQQAATAALDVRSGNEDVDVEGGGDAGPSKKKRKKEKHPPSE